MTRSLIQKPTSKLVHGPQIGSSLENDNYFVAIISYISLSKEKIGSVVCVTCKNDIIGSGVFGHSRTFKQGSS